jgi:hypothetical protein
VAYLEDEETYASSGGGGRRYPPPDPRRQFLVRRAAALGVGILLLILIVLGVRGCLDARKERGFENYVRDLNTIAAQTNQLSDNFFGRLEDPGKLTELSFEAEISSDRGAAEDLLQRVQSLDTPDELDGAQSELVQAYELRRDGLAGIDEQIAAALGKQDSTEATNAIADYMRYFLASDVLYDRAQSLMDPALSDEGIEVDGAPAKAPESEFLPDERWLDPLEVRTALAGVTGEQVTPGVHGLGLLQVTASPGGVLLEEATPATISGSGQASLEVQVQNQGDADESDVVVTYSLSGGAETIEGDATIASIAAGAIKSVDLPIDPAPETGEPLTLEVNVLPVEGEQVADNNTATYEITFE